MKTLRRKGNGVQQEPQLICDSSGERAGAVMGEQATALTVVVAGTIVLACRHSRISITDDVRDKVYVLIKSVLALYLLDLFLLLGFGIPFPALHEGTPAGIAISLFIILVVIMNLACEYTDIRPALSAGNKERWVLNHILGFGVSLLWLFVEVSGIILKIVP